ncbi:uncharacterized protein LOC124943832 [Impatiens glandulifera]|uniref:uncharacterized protein LOC124943832 n=1 Tax=Impatiens glandulifera TaxID=253017 RepID=UPI001FB0CDE8|nr:uncharacterized protein LOC124943832 [Impatiens glandulifera]
MVKPDSTRSWGYANPLGKIMLHNNINTGPGVLLSSSKIIRSRKFLEKKQPASGSSGGRIKKAAAKKPAPVKGGPGGKKDKEPIVFTEPPSETRDEEDSAFTSDRTASQKSDENPSDKEGPIEEKQSATSLDNVGAAASLENTDAGADGRGEEEVPADNDQKMAEKIVRKVLEEIHLQAKKAAQAYSEWFLIRCNKFFKHVLPDLTTGQRFERILEIEEDVIRLTNVEDPNEAMDRHAIVEPRARLQKLTAHIRKLSERYVAGAPKAKLQLLVLDILKVKKGEFIDEIERLEAVRRQRDTTYSPRLETDDGQNRGDTPPLADPVINETDERTETPFTGPLETNQPGDSESVVTEERVKTLIQEFAKRKVRPWKRKIKKAALQTIKLSKTTRDDLVKADARITEIEADYRDDTILHNEHLKRTEDLEDKTSKMLDDLERFQEKTDQRLTKVDEDLGRSSTKVGSTLDRVTYLEKKNASLEERNDKLEADLKALTEQVTELINAKLNADKAVEEANARAAKDIQDALDEETRKAKEAPRLTDEEIAVRAQNIAARNPELAKIMAAKQVEEANRLKAQQDTYHNFEKAHKRTKAASSSSVPATRKRKTLSKKVQVTGMLERITETIIETPPNPAMQTEDEIEENLEPRSTRQRVLNTASISTVGQPQTGGSSSRPAQPDEEQPTDDMLKDFLPFESE